MVARARFDFRRSLESGLVHLEERGLISGTAADDRAQERAGKHKTATEPNWNAGKIKQILGQAKDKTGAAKGGGTGNLFSYLSLMWTTANSVLSTQKYSNQHFQIPIRSGTHGHFLTSSYELLSAPWVNKLQFTIKQITIYKFTIYKKRLVFQHTVWRGKLVLLENITKNLHFNLQSLQMNKGNVQDLTNCKLLIWIKLILKDITDDRNTTFSL